MMVYSYKYVMLFTSVSVNKLSLSQLDLIMKTLHIMILNALPFIMQLDMFVMFTKEGVKISTLQSLGLLISPAAHAE